MVHKYGTQVSELHKILLVVNSAVGGVEYHRQLAPHNHLQDYCPEFDVSQIMTDVGVQMGIWKKYDLMQFSRVVNVDGETTAILKECRKNDIITILDIDDHWKLHPGHGLASIYKEHNVEKQTVEAIREVDHVTTTQPYFADIIRKVNKNVTVIPNAIDPRGDQWHHQESPHKGSKLTFGWVGGVHHKPDIELLRSSMGMMSFDYKITDLFDVAFSGGIPDDPYSWPKYTEFAKVLTAGGKIPARRIKGVDVYNYAKHYHELDVSLIPLHNYEFNRCKSNLKMVEAGFKGRACIVSDIPPYSDDIRHMKNCMAVKEHKSHNGFYKAMKFMLSNRAAVTDMAKQLHEDMTEKYHMDVVNPIRRDLYKQLLKTGKA